MAEVKAGILKTGNFSFSCKDDTRLKRPFRYFRPTDKSEKAFFESVGAVNAGDPETPFPAKKIPGEPNSPVRSLNQMQPNKINLGGPSQPEMSSFKSVGSDNMVNLFSGDFSYNIPLLDVGGYPVNIFYSSGISMDQEASWVGLGWNINPGTVSRAMRGVPDDFNGTDKITKTRSMRPDRTWGVNAGGGVEWTGVGLGLNGNMGISFNNRLGLATEMNISPSMGISAKAGDNKTAGLNFSVGLNLSSRSGASVTPSVGISYSDKSSSTGGWGAGASASLGYNSRQGLTALHVSAEVHSLKKWEKTTTEKKSDGTEVKHTETGYNNGAQGTSEASISFAYPSVTPTITMPLTRFSVNGSFKMGSEVWSLHPHVSFGGFYTKSFIAEKDKVINLPSYGMLYMDRGNNDKNALLDFNRIQDGVYTKTSPTIGMPAYSYDVFNIAGEGTGGVFRAYRGDLGYVHDPFVKTREDAGSVGVELGFGGPNVHVGGNLQYVYTPTTAGEWQDGNLARNSFGFKKSKGAFQSVYFKNPGEKAIPDVAFQDAIGGEDLVRMQLTNAGTGTGILSPALEKINPANNGVTGTLNMTNVKKARDKRTQVINCLTAEEASRAGLDTAIYSYQQLPGTPVIFGNCAGINPEIQRIDRLDGYRKNHHISEINVLDQEGKKYVYGIPVYNTKQVEVTMAIKKEESDTSTMLSNYNSTDDSPDNQNGRDWYYEKQETPPYAHSYLITALVSPNYVDVKGDGITDDDMGDAVKFNYTKSAEFYKWRTPFNKANYTEGLKTFPKDDKAHYVYGEREQWYLYSIESKNMIGRFYVSENRCDGRSVMGQGGGILSTSGMKRLEKIELYSKADLSKLGNAAKPIKTVHFDYDYSLCPGTPDNNGSNVDKNYNNVPFSSADNINKNRGKLTLKSIWFTYNGNEKAKNNKYTFRYPTDNNPAYSYTANDRWGNYKPFQDENGNFTNPGKMTNSEHPYAVKDKQKADKYAAAWSLSSISLPSGGKMDITYESDDYAFVQDRRAATMLQIKGFGYSSSPTGDQTTNNAIYNSGQCDYIYLELPFPVSTKAELTARYFADVKQLFIKLAVNMPPDDNGSNRGLETIPMYADIDGDNYGLVSGSNNLAYIKVKRMESANTPMVQYSLQYIKSFLPHKAYSGYDVSENSSLKAVVIALAGMVTSVTELFQGDFGKFMSKGKCKRVDLERSFVRLSEPTGIKMGGGLRVKKVVVSDNWNKLTGGYESTYGQEYKYTKTELINSSPVEISSGVASWEPSIGGEENPHREIIRNLNRNKAGPFEFGATEMPMGEMFYPSPSVGYSRVEVNSIHRDTVKNAPGKTVTEYYTTREFPYKSSFSALLPGSGKIEYNTSPILKLLHVDILQRNTLSQGFKVDMNDMNGREKSTAAYSTLDPLNPISKTTNYYNVTQRTDKTFQFNHTFPTIEKSDGVINPNGVIGRDIEIMADFREHKSITYTSNLTLNLDLLWFGWFPVPLFNPLSPFYLDESTYRSAAVTKIVNHYAILDSVVVVDKGSMVSTKNLVYDAETGNVLLTRTNNEFNKPVYSFNYPAHWAYNGMGPAYKNIDANFENLTFRKGLLQNNIDMDIFETGDEIYVMSQRDKGPLKSDICDNFNCDDPYLIKNTAKRIWAVKTSIGGANPSRLVFIDRYGEPYTADKVYVRIIRSGRRNMLGQMVGSVTSLESPIVPSVSNGQPVKKIDFASASVKVLNTTAATFKERWRTDNSFYEEDFSTYIRTKVFPQMVLDDNPVVTTVKKDGLNYSLVPNNFTITAASRIPSDSADENETTITKSFIKYTALENFLNLNLDPSCLIRDAVHYTTGVVCADAFWDEPKLVYASHYCNSAVAPPGTLWNPPPFLDHPGVHNTQTGYHGLFSTATPFGNITILQTMKTAWYADNDLNSWKNAFRLNDFYDPNASQFDYMMSHNPLYGWGHVKSSDGYRVDGLIKRMMIERKNGNNTSAAGFSYQIFDYLSGANFNNIKCLTKTQDNTCNQFCTPGLHFAYFPCPGGKIESLVSPNYPMNGAWCKTLSQLNKVCRSKFDRKAINPYVEGIMGNWRLDSTYVYYGERTEKDPNVKVDLRAAGTIANYKNFWNFGTDFLQRNNLALDVWVWNSVITQYNRKGYEVENHDPLGRYNSGLYGYNQQLPIAITNNARVRETMFDGFEDYDYSTGNCTTTEACKSRRQISFGDIKPKVKNTQRHTGKSSLELSSGQSVDFTASVLSESSLALKDFNVRVKIDSIPTPVQDTFVSPKGTGFKAKYYNYSNSNKKKCRGVDESDAWSVLQTYDNNPSNDPAAFVEDDQIQYSGYEPGSSGSTWQLPSGIHSGRFCVRWNGYVQPVKTAMYSFKSYGNDGYSYTITDAVTNAIVLNMPRFDCDARRNPPDVSAPVLLTKGRLYKISFSYFHTYHGAQTYLLWKYLDCMDFEPIPLNQVYSPDKLADANGTVTMTNGFCTSLDSIHARGNVINDSFSLIQGKKMLISAWVKETVPGTPDCKCSTYTHNNIHVSFTRAGNAVQYNTADFVPTGNIIEGWQRIEAIVDIPLDATNIMVSLNNTETSGNRLVYFDDVRMHPFNANMKSFVYHPSNLRLMSELDENNYASFYEYDDDGTLVRVKKETIAGIKTIKETRSALQKKEQ